MWGLLNGVKCWNGESIISIHSGTRKWLRIVQLKIFWPYSIFYIFFKALNLSWKVVCFTILCWFLPSINMNQPWADLCPLLSWLALPPPSPSLSPGLSEQQIWAPCVMQQIYTGYLILHRVTSMFQCYTLISSHPLLPPLCPQFCSLCLHLHSVSSVQPLSRVRLFATPGTAARQASLSITNSRCLLKLMSIELVMPSSHLILCSPLLLLPSIFPSIRVFSNESVLRIRWPKYWSFSFNISPSNEHSGLIFFRMDRLDLLAMQETHKSLLQHRSSKASILQCSAFFIIQLSHPYMTTGKTIALTRQTFVGKVISLFFNMLSRLFISFSSKEFLLISWLQSPSAVILEPPKIKPATVSAGSPSICHEVMGPDALILVFWMLSFTPAFSLSSFTFIKRLFSSSSLSAIRVVSSAYLRLLIFLSAILILTYAFSNPLFLMMCSANKLNKHSDNIQFWCTPFPIWNPSVVPCPILTVASWPTYRFLKRQVRWSGIPISFTIFHNLLWSTQWQALV